MRMYTFMIKDKQLDKLKELSKKTETSASELIRVAIDLYLKKKLNEKQ